jgi:hypothetical protein
MEHCHDGASCWRASHVAPLSATLSRRRRHHRRF